jgi:hypothetical protein
MTGQNVSRRSTIIRRVASSLAAMAAFVAVNTPASSSAQTFIPQDYANQVGPSGSVSGDVLNFNGRGAGVLLRGGHVAGQTVGRQESISHIGAMPYATFGNSLIFGDGRFVRTNDNGLAWSFGTGFRHYFSDVDAVFGLNGYFDRDQHTGAHFQEWGIGAELLSHNWEWRGNMYKPFGDTEELLSIEAIPNSSVFVGNELQFNQVRNLATTLEGFDTEFGVLLPGPIAERHKLRLFGGAYYFETSDIEFTGWKARLSGNLFDWLEGNVEVTNDDEFDTNVTFSVAMNFGGYRENAPSNNSRYRLGEPVRRNYTFSTDTTRIVDAGVTAINSANGAAFNVVHVNSNAGAVQNGTAEFPFSSIAAGQATGSDIIFVHGGSEWIGAPDNSVILRSDTRILGEGLIVDASGNRVTQHFVDAVGPGPVQLGASPDFIDSNSTLLRPLLANSAGDAVTLADDVEFSGFRISAANGNGIFGNAVENVVLNQNDVRDTLGDGIQLVNPDGINQVVDTVIANTGGVAFHVDGGDAETVFGQTSSDVDPGLGRVQNSSGLAVRILNTEATGFVSFAGGSVAVPGTSATRTVFGATIDDDGGMGVSLENNAGDVTLDNLRLANSTSHGINIDGGSGTFTFLSTIRDAGIEITNPALNAVNIVNLESGGEVIFGAPIIVDGHGGSGFHFEGVSGDIEINDPVTITNQGGIAGAGISFINNPATASVFFRDDVTITSTLPSVNNGVGILSSGNLFDEATGDRASLRFGLEDSDFVLIENVDGDNIRIQNDAASVRFEGDVTIANRGPVLPNPARTQPSHGILIDNSTGRISFNGLTSIDNPNNITDSAVEIASSQANVLFNDLFADETLGDAGVQLTNNLEGELGEADLVFVNLDINSDTGGTSLLAANNSSIRVFDGTIEANAGQAVDITTSGIDMQFTSIDSTAANPFAIRIEDTFRATQGAQQDSSFVVTGEDNGGAGAGGTITGAAVAGAFLRNPGIVRLNQMDFQDNEIGIDVAYTNLLESPSPGQLPRVETGLLELDSTNFEDSNNRAIDGVNVPRLLISNALYEDNGDAANGAETIRLQYTEDPSEDADLGLYDFPFLVQILDSEIENVDPFDLITISNGVGGQEAHLQLDIQRNSFDSTTGDLLVVNWDGPLFGEVNANLFTLDTAEVVQFGVFVNNNNDDDDTELDFLTNTWEIGDAGLGNLVGDEKIGLFMELEGPAEIEISNSVVTLDGDELTAFEFDFNGLTTLRMIGNDIQDNFFFTNEDNRGVFIDRIGAGSTFQFEDNFITLQGDDARGLEIDAFGVINLVDTGFINIININAFGDFEFDFDGATPNGQLNINGALVP